jgi:ribulose-5-phosphate 4-epimerase/fuculose-1-phosphate aldolase
MNNCTYCRDNDDGEFMSNLVSGIKQTELISLRELSAQVGGDPLLTQASAGNASIKHDGVLWIKASGKWMADAMHDDVLIPLDLSDIWNCMQQKFDPAEHFARASIETAMHAVLPHRVVLHVHSVNTIAWAVRRDARIQLEHRLRGMRWQWIPYVPSGLPLAIEIEKALSVSPDAEVFILGNHGLVIGGDDRNTVEALLSEVEQRMAVCPRKPESFDNSALAEIAGSSPWNLPDDDVVHALGRDAISRAILPAGLLYPCQSMLSSLSTPEVFRPIPFPDRKADQEDLYDARSFLIIEHCGVLVKDTMTPTQRATLGGLARVVQRISASAPIRYLTDKEVLSSSSMIVSTYLERADANRCNQTGYAR